MWLVPLLKDQFFCGFLQISPSSYVFCLSGYGSFLACNCAISEHANLPRLLILLCGKAAISRKYLAVHQNLLRPRCCAQRQEGGMMLYCSFSYERM